MQRTDSIFFIVVSKYAVGKAREVKSELTQSNTGNSQRNQRNIGLPAQYFKIISTHSLIRETKQMQSSIKKSGWIIDHLKNILVCSIAE